MTLGKKVSLISILIMAATILTYYGIFRFIVLSSFLELDADHARQDTARCEAALAREIKHLNTFTHDWASWDDTCRFLKGTQDNFVDDNLQDQVFEDQKLNLLHIYDEKGHLVWGKAYDLKKNSVMSLDLEAEIGKHKFQALIKQKEPKTSTSGIIITRHGIMMVSSNPILTSQNKGPSRGAFVMGRLFTKQVLSMLSEQVNVRLEAWSLEDPNLPREMDAIIQSINGNVHIRLIEASPVLMHSYSLIRDIQGHPALLMRASIPRDIMNKGAWAYKLGLLMIIGMGVLMFVCMSGMMKFMILNPIRNLKLNVVAIRESGTAAESFETKQQDEIGTLSQEFFAMMKKLNESQERIDLALKGGGLGSWDVDLRTGRILIDDRCAEILGYHPAEIVDAGEIFLGSIHPYDHKQVIRSTMEYWSGKTFSYQLECRAITNQGTMAWLDVRGEAVERNPDGSVIRMAGTVMDITQSKHTQEELRKHHDLLEELVVQRTLDLTTANEHLESEIEEKNRTEKALMKSEEKYLTHFSLANDVLYVIDPEFRVASVSPSVERVLGYKPEDMLGKPFQDLGVLHPDDLEKAASDTLRVLAGGKVISAVYRFFDKDGAIRYGEVSGVPLVQDGLIIGVISVARDITEYKQAEQSLMISEEKYRTILESIEETYFELDLSGNFIFFSDPLCRALGYSRHELTGMNYRRIIAPANFDEIYQTFHEIFITGNPKTMVNFKVITRNGEMRFAELSASLLHSLAGESIGFRGVWRDVTERIQAEQAIKESEQRYRRITSSITGYIFTVHVQDGRAVRTVHGPACVAVTGYTPEEFETDPYLWCTMVAEEDRRMVQEHAFLILCGENVGLIEHRIRRKDGDIRWVCNAPVLHYDSSGHLTSYDGVISDITERKLAEEELRKSEERYRITLQGMPDAVSIMRISDARYLYVNDGFCTMTGFSCHEIIGKTMAELNLPAHSHDSETLLSAMNSTEGIQNVKACFRTRVNQILDTLISARPIQYEGENCMIVVLTDITALKRAEEQKQDLEIMLSQAQKMEAIGTLAGGIAHDFNNILTAIIGYTEMAMLCISDEVKATQKLNEAIKASERAKDLVCQILAFSRKSETKYESLALHSVVKESIKMLRALIPTTIEIRQDTIDPVHVMADSTKIHQIIMNLCTNAAHSMQEAYGLLEVSLMHVELDDDAAHPLELASGSYARLMVSDTGHGMPPEVAERIFEPYFTTKEKGRGTGLGLSVVHGIVKSHNGAITCMSEIGKGTVFDIYLPEIEAAQETMDHIKHEPCPVGVERILYVDDELIMVEVVEEMLQNLGYSVVARSSSVEALKLFQETPWEFDMVITDMTMPVMTGDMLARKMLEIRSDIPIILCTGYSEQISEEKALAMGISEFIMKPLDIHKLGGAVRKVIDGKGSSSLEDLTSYGTC
jgi:PAS domain S-box-containing protein